MSRRARVWTLAAFAVIAVIAAMASITRTLLDTEREAQQGRADAAQEEQIRLALWRLDGAIPGRLSKEMARVALLAETLGPEQTVPLEPGEHIHGRFVRDADGEIRWLTPPATPRLDALATNLSSDTLPRSLGTSPTNPDLPDANLEAPPQQEQTQQGYFSSRQQRARGNYEWSRRAANVRDNLDSIQTVSALNSLSADQLTETVGNEVYRSLADAANPDTGRAGPPARLGPVTPLWVSGELLLARRVRRGELVEFQGLWLDASAWLPELVAEIDDLVPGATLAPVPSMVEADPARTLATLPLRLVPGPAPTVQEDSFSPVRASLALGWSVVLAGTGVVIGLLMWAWSLSERRAAFVSAVTHELRTPLTTFRMYTEMLSEKMVESKRDHYIATLRREADRLGHLVENVLAYARIEGKRPQPPLESSSIEDLIARVQDRLRARCDAAGAELQIAIPKDAGEAQVRTDPTAVEQVLFNLVDNAAKYGPSKTQNKIVLEAVGTDRTIRLAVRDYGPGVHPQERRKIFEAFAKSREDASGTKPGVGLGLALCRQLASQLGGSLRVEDAAPGARFILEVPRT